MPHAPDAHASHDPLLVAAFAAGDATGDRLAEATALVATCEACAALHHDLRAIAAALPVAAPGPRPRDFRLSAEQAAALQPTRWRRLLALLAGPRFAFAGPLGAGLATLGLAGILVIGAAGIPLGGAAMAERNLAGGATLQAPAPAQQPPGASAGDGLAFDQAVPTGSRASVEAPPATEDAQEPTTPTPAWELAGASLVALVAGAVLLGSRWAARRAI
jgi:hypothetical protein